MTTKQLSRYLLDEELCEHFLREYGVLKIYNTCPACNSTHFDRVRRQRYMCYGCKYEWNIRRDSFLEGSHLKLSIFIACLKFFADDIPAFKCAAELEVSRDTVNNVYHSFRSNLVGPIDKLLDSKEFTVRIALKVKQIVITLDDVDNEGARLKIVRSKNNDGAFYYVASYKNFRVKKLLRSLDKIDELDDFYRYCQERLLNFRGRDQRLLHWKMRELAFRYNNRHENIFEILISKFSFNRSRKNETP